MDGGAGFDRVIFQGSSDLTVDLRLTTAQTTGEGVDTITNVEHITASSVNDLLIGSNDANAFLGLGGNDTLLGLDGNDALSGGDGNDILVGGNGNDLMDGGAGGMIQAGSGFVGFR